MAEDVKAEVKNQIPDTNKSSNQEDSYAQNLMFALDYLLAHVTTNDPVNIHRCADMFMQHIDLLNYEVDAAYDEKLIV